MNEVELANVSVGSTRIVVWMESSLSEIPLQDGENLEVYLLINDHFNADGLEYFFPEFTMSLWVSTSEASLYEIQIVNCLNVFGKTDDQLKASLTEEVERRAALIEKFNSVSEML